MDGIERADGGGGGGESTRGAEHLAAHGHEHARGQQPVHFLLHLFSGIRQFGGSRDLDAREPARGQDDSWVGKVRFERLRLRLVDDELDQRRRVGVDEAALSAQRDLPREPRSRSSRLREDIA